MEEANTSEEEFNLNGKTGSTTILERGEARSSGVPLFCAHWHIFIPTLISFVAYSFAWFFLAITERSDGSLARLFIVVISIGVPLLAGHAFLRYQTIRLQVNADRLLCHPGWPKEIPIEVPFETIDKVEIKRGLYGHIFDGGTIVIHLKTHGKIAIADLSDPETVRQEIFTAMENYEA